MKNRTLAAVLALVMLLGTVAAAAGSYMNISVVPGIKLEVNGEEVVPVNAAGEEIEVFAYKDATYLPLRYLAELLGIDIDWDQETQTAKVGTAPAVTASAEAEGFEETVTVTLSVADGKLVDVTAVTTSTSEIGKAAIDTMPAAMLEKNTVHVDGVTGATGTSSAILAAANKAMAEITEQGASGDMDAWALANGYVKAEKYNINSEVDAVTSPTANGDPSGLNFGFIDFSEEGLKGVIAEALAGPYTWGVNEPKNEKHTAEKYVEGVDLTGTPMYRDMYVVGTSYNNIPNTATIELVYDPYTSMFYGSSEAGTSKISELKENPYVTMTYVTQMNKTFIDQLGEGFPAYADYGKLHSVMIYGKVHLLTDDDFDGGEQEEKALRALDVYMPTYYATRWPFATIDPTAAVSYDDAEVRAAKVAAAKTELQGVSAKYYIEPYRITMSLYSTFAPFKISGTSAWSTYKTYSIKTEEASANNGYVESWTGISNDQYCQAAIEKTPGSVNAGLRYWYKSDTSWDFTWSEDGKELLAVTEHTTEDGESVPYTTPYLYPWVRSSFEELTGKLRQEWAAENEDVLIEKAGENVDVTFSRKVAAKELTIAEGEVRKAGEVVKDDEIEAKGLVLGEDYIIQEITLPNYTYYALTYENAMSGVRSQQNYRPYPEVDPVKRETAKEEEEEVLPEGVESDGTFHYALLDDGTYEIVKYAITKGQSINVEVPAEYNGKAVTSIGKEAFKDLTNITKIHLPSTVTVLKEGAFAGVKSLKHLWIPASVTTIEKDVLNRTGWGNMNVDSFCIVEFEATTPPAQELMMGAETMGLDGTQVHLKVASEAALEAYTAAWAGYADLISTSWVNPE